MKRSDSEMIEQAIEEEPEAALKMVQELLEEGENDPDVWGYLAETKTELGDHKGALAAWAHYLTLDPHWPEAYTARAELYADRGNLSAAELELGLAQDLGEDDPRVLRCEALLLEIAGQWREADELYDEAEELDPLWPAPPRMSRATLASALNEHYDGGSVDTEEMPSEPGPDGLLRLLDVHPHGDVTVYLRNLEREFDGEATLRDLLEAFDGELEA